MGEKSTLPYVIFSGSETTWRSFMIEYTHDLSDHRFIKGKDAQRQANAGSL
ncbi:MAG: hypothetical protein SVZ03_10745 [Spirochaetota bacterium]|nr:hypothetical protein [Spirochaetota bacterium]